jgi:hypothetical protein
MIIKTRIVEISDEHYEWLEQERLRRNPHLVAMERNTPSIWLIEEQLAYALGASVGDERVMKQAENSARWRYHTATVMHPLMMYAFIQKATNAMWKEIKSE